ncbi:hypothetical protein ABW21_db0209852 [Orbilia brochopaga]|nr:hypothetical protein ABW21_db0209852 [Drechslerella brochopaga]
MAEQPVIDHLRVLHDFDARSPDELSLKKNAKIELLERDEEYNDGWYLKQCLGDSPAWRGVPLRSFPLVCNVTANNSLRDDRQLESVTEMLAKACPERNIRLLTDVLCKRAQNRGEIQIAGKLASFHKVCTDTNTISAENRATRTSACHTPFLTPAPRFADPAREEGMAAYGGSVDFAALREQIRQNILYGANSRRSSSVYTAQWPSDAAQASAIDNQVPPDGDAASAYSNAPLEPKQEIPKRLSVTPELLLEDSNFGPPSKELTAETPPLSVENNDKRRVSEEFRQLHRSPVVVDTLSDIEEALSEIRTAPRQKNKQPPPIMETPETHRLAEQGFDEDSASDYSNSALENDSSHSLPGAKMPMGAMYETTYTTRSADSIQKQTEHPLQYSQAISDQSSSEDGEEVVEESLYSWDEVRMWTPEQVSAYFQEQQLPLNICDKFEEQEISGSILLQLEMSHLKELEIGSFGKRFEVWKEIEKLQTMVKDTKAPVTGDSPSGRSSQARNRSSSTPSGVLPRLPSLHNRPPVRGGSFALSHTQPELFYDHMGIIRESPALSLGAPIPPPKSDLGSIGVNSDRRSLSTASMERASSSGGQQPLKNHGRDPSFDRNWTLKGHRATESTASGSRRFTGDSGFASQSSSVIIYANDRSNVSGEDGGKRDRNVLHKRVSSAGSQGHHSHHSHHSSLGQAHSPGHGKKSSFSEEQRRGSGNHTPASPSPSPGSIRVVSKQTFPVMERSYETVQQPVEDSHLPVHAPAQRPLAHANLAPGYSSASPASVAYYNNSVKSRKRSTSDAHILAMDNKAREALAASVMPGGKTMAVELPPPEEERHVPPNIQTMRANAGYPRSASDGAEKAMAMSPMSQDTSSTLLSPNDSEHSNSLKITIDMPERRSDESKQRNGHVKDKKLRSVASASGIRQKSKKQMTSAYQEGLREVSPTQAAEEADFSGWMKKRGSSAVVATWKSRFFVLKGRRLSYFYSMDDTKERGLIDITSHRVLPAADDRIVALHASVAAITTSTPASQASSANPGNMQSSPTLPPTPPQKGGWFTFKLVPPAPGAAKGVTFTPPKLHYFATDSKYIGRQWMAAFMKATIDRDETAPVISTFSANTISLAKARAMRARPPGFGDISAENPKPSLFGLPIMGSQGSFNDSIESALAERHLIEDDMANAADDER